MKQRQTFMQKMKNKAKLKMIQIYLFDFLIYLLIFTYNTLFKNIKIRSRHNIF